MVECLNFNFPTQGWGMWLKSLIQTLTQPREESHVRETDVHRQVAEPGEERDVGEGEPLLSRAGNAVPDSRPRDLAEVREILDNAGGDIYLRSRPGGSSEFIIRVPYEQHAA